MLARVKKLLRGIAEFRRRRSPWYVDDVAKHAMHQAPDALLICCSDSRVAPNVFASVEPGDLLVVRNIGNLVPEFVDPSGYQGGTSVPAAIEFAIHRLHVRDIIVCGHSECGAMHAIASAEDMSKTPHLAYWLRHGKEVLEDRRPAPAGMPRHDYLSQRNALLQLTHLRTYPAIQEAEAEGRLRLNAWWFNIARAEVLDYDEPTDTFVPLDDLRVERRLATPD